MEIKHLQVLFAGWVYYTLFTADKRRRKDERGGGGWEKVRKRAGDYKEMSSTLTDQ
jgi:hypothetical protein